FWGAAGDAASTARDGILPLRLLYPPTSLVVRYFGDSVRTGRLLGEEGRAAENVYIQKMEREKLEKLRRKADQEKADAAKQEAAGKGNQKQKCEGAHPS
uniref:Uncharacterized protein n=1 Tax=Aegilops tauschii subsp. strangulata TaxID=200361 RepID=A0A453JJE7_AEGTS